MSPGPSSFTVTSADQKVRLDANGSAQASFTVMNTSAQTLRARLLARPGDTAKPEWFSVVGETVRLLAPNVGERVAVQLNVAPTPAPGTYSFRLDAVSEANPDEDYTEGPSVTFEIEAPKPPDKPFPWLVVAVVGGVVLLGIIVIVIVLIAR